MKRDLAAAGKALGAAGLGGAVSYLVATVPAHVHVYWPYWLFLSAVVTGIVLYFVDRGASVVPGPSDPGHTDSGSADVPRMLPSDTPTFAGRAAFLERLKEETGGMDHAEAAARVCAIDGMPGVGKTAFAVHAAHLLSDRFTDGQLYLQMQGHTSGQEPLGAVDALATLLRLLGTNAEQIPAGLDQRAALWRDRMAGKRALVVLDDALRAEQVLPLLPNSASVMVLITSRPRLTELPVTSQITLETLDPLQAAELVLRVSGRSDLRTSDGGMAELTELCGHLPLALCLVASRLRHRPAWVVSDMVEELRSATHRISQLGAGQHSVAAAFDMSYRNLNGAQQQMFRRLGLQFGPDLDAFAAAALNDTDIRSARTLLDELYDFHLIQEFTRGRYRFHDLIREHAQLRGSEDSSGSRQAATDRLLDYYLDVARRADRYLARRSHVVAYDLVGSPPSSAPRLTSPTEALDWMRAEQANLIAAADFAARQGRSRHAIAIPIAMHGFLRADGPWDRAVELHSDALAIADRTGDRPGQAETLNNLGVMRRLTGDLQGAEDCLSRARKLGHELGEQGGEADALRGEANALSYLGVIERLKGNPESAIRILNRALTMHRKAGDEFGEANSFNYLGVAQRRAGLHQDAIASQERALMLFQKIGDRLGAADALLERGLAQLDIKDYVAAVDSMAEAGDTYHGLGNRLGEANSLKYLGAVKQLTHDSSATTNLRRALELYREIGSKKGEENIIKRLGNIQESI